MSNAIEINSTNWSQEVIDSDKPVLVDFWADWCGPCRMLSPVIDEIAKEYAGKVKVCKVNVDNNQLLANEFGIRGIPSLLIFKKGEILDRLVGVQPKSVISGKLDSAL